jgi:hypothetical protein
MYFKILKTLDGIWPLLIFIRFIPPSLL